MDSLNGIGISGSTNQSEPTQSQPRTPVGGELGQSQFMTLLVAQLKNQDPLQPLDNSEFISQLATFSSLEKLSSIESILKSHFGSDPSAAAQKL